LQALPRFINAIAPESKKEGAFAPSSRQPCSRKYTEIHELWTHAPLSTPTLSRFREDGTEGATGPANISAKRGATAHPAFGHTTDAPTRFRRGTLRATGRRFKFDQKWI